MGETMQAIEKNKANYQVLLSEKNKEMVQDIYGCLYWKNNYREDRIYWRCIFCQAGADGDVGSKCPGYTDFTHTASLKELFVTGRAVTFNGKLSVTAEHNHLGDSARVELKRLQGVVQREAVLSKEAPRSIVADCIAGVSEEAKPLVRRSLLARNIRSIRNEENLESANPKNLHELLVSFPSPLFVLSVIFTVPNEYKLLDGEEFLKYDGWNNDERIMIFSTNRCLDLLQSINKWGVTAPYVGQLISAQKRKKPRFDTKAWNIRVLIETGEPTTSNGIESFNGQMIRTMAASHPTIWKLIEGLRKEFALSQQRVAAYYAGENTPRRGIAYRHANERIKKVVGRYHEIPTKVDFLKAIAINLGSVAINSVY